VYRGSRAGAARSRPGQQAVHQACASAKRGQALFVGAYLTSEQIAHVILLVSTAVP